MSRQGTAPLRCVLVVAVLCAASVARAQTCSWSVSGGVSFGSVDTLSGSNVDVTGTASISCSGGTPSGLVRLCPNIGPGSSGVTESNRRMLSGANALNYQLYQDSSRTIVWGSDLFADPPTPPALTLQLNLLGSGSLNSTIFARVFGGQSAAPVGPYQSSFSGLEARLRYEGCLLGICPACSSSLGALADTSFTVSATAASNCRVSATTLDFGSKGVLSANVDATNAIDIQCTPGTPWTASLNAGSGSGGTVNLRRMTGPGGATVAYTIYSNAGRTQIWGDGTSGTSTVTGIGTGDVKVQTGYGRVPPQTTPAPATYTDTVVVTITY